MNYDLNEVSEYQICFTIGENHFLRIKIIFSGFHDNK